MNDLVRFGVSLPRDLLARFDRLIKSRKYGNRSEALRDLIRNELGQETAARGGTVAGAVLIVYDHHARELTGKLTGIQHDYHDVIVSSQHVHLDHHHCLETVVVRGPAARIQAFSDLIRAQKGVLQGGLTLVAGQEHTH